MKHLIMFLAIGAISAATADALVIPPTIQGIDYRKQIEQRRSRCAMSQSEDVSATFELPEAKAVPEGEFTFDMIQSWAGQGNNRAALVIQWNNDSEKTALVFGYRWDGIATGADMIKAVIEANPRLYGLIQYTNVSSPVDPIGGYTINGFGWDADDDGDISLIDEGHGNTRYENENGLFIHPRGYNPDTGSSPDYDYDDWKCSDPDDYWGAGWYLSYWSYWVKDGAESQFGYSGVGASGRVLEDGCWDGWNFSLNMMPYDWKEFEAAPPLIPAGAKTEFEYNGLYYKLKNYERGTVALVSPLAIESFETADYSGDIEIPGEFVDGDRTYTVVEIADEAFAGYAIGEVTMPQSITAVGNGAFMGSTITALTGSAQLKKIGTNAFYYCTELHEFDFPADITTIPDGMFDSAGLTSAVIPDGVTAIGNRAFADDVVLENIVIPASVKVIADEAFAGCTGLRHITVFNTYPLSIGTSVFAESTYADALLTVPTGYEDAYRAAEIWKNFNNMSQVNIPVNESDVFLAGGITYRVSSMGESKEVVATHARTDNSDTPKDIASANAATYTGALTVPTSVVFQDIEFKVVSLDERVFYGSTTLESVDIQAAVATIPDYAFSDCTALADVKLPQSLTSAGSYAFAYSALTAVQLPETVTSLGQRCFFQCQKLGQIELPSALSTVDNYAFAYCTSLKSISFGDGVKSIGCNMFQNCTMLESVSLPGALTEIPAYTFQNCSALQHLSLPEGLVKIGNNAFSGCTALSLQLPASVTSLGAEALRGMVKLTEFTLPETMVTVPQGLFYDCINLQRVTFAGEVTAIENNAFRNCTSLCAIVKADSPAAEADEPADDNVILTIPDGVTSLGQYCFAGCNQITEMILPDGLTSLGNYIFDGASKLARINIPEGVKSLPGWGFRNTAITDIEIPSTISSMTYSDVFGNCTGARLFVNNTVPFNVGSYSLRISGTDFVPVVVPFGCADTFKATSNWKKSTVIAPEFVSAYMVIESAVLKDGQATISGRLENKFNIENMPGHFRLLNNATFIATCTPQLSVRVKGSEDDYALLPLEVASDGSWTAEFAWNSQSNEAEAFIGLGNDSEATTPLAEILLNTGMTSSLTDTAADRSVRFRNNTISVYGHNGEMFTVFDICGHIITEFTADSDNFSTFVEIRPGVYLLRGADKNFKFVVL